MTDLRLDVLLIRRYPELSRRKARAAIEKGQVSVGGRLALEAGELLTESADIAWDVHQRARSRARLDLPRLYEDEHLLIVNKPAGLLSVPTPGGHEDSALGRVRDYATHLHPARPYVGKVHRLDRGTSGALAFALSPSARAGLIELFRAHRIERRYLALVEGRPKAEQGTIDAPIHDDYEGGRRRLARAGEEGQPARTHYRVRERFERAALLELTLETGRQHQIRLHLSTLGLPIVGDATYGEGGTPRARVPTRRPLLHAWVLGLTLPLAGITVRAEAPLPEDFERALRQLRGRR